jgi:hypothetical protein
VLQVKRAAIQLFSGASLAPWSSCHANSESYNRLPLESRAIGVDMELALSPLLTHLPPFPPYSRLLSRLRQLIPVKAERRVLHLKLRAGLMFKPSSLRMHPPQSLQLISMTFLVPRPPDPHPPISPDRVRPPIEALTPCHSPTTVHNSLLETILARKKKVHLLLQESL